MENKRKSKKTTIIGDGNSYIESDDGSKVSAINDFKKVPWNKKDFRRLYIVLTIVLVILLILGISGVLGYSFEIIELFSMRHTFSKGNIPYYECGNLGTSFDDVIQKCGKNYEIIQNELNEDWLQIHYTLSTKGYNSKIYYLNLEFYRNKLVSIQLKNHPKYREFTNDQVKFVFDDNTWSNDKFRVSITPSWRSYYGNNEGNSPIYEVSITTKNQPERKDQPKQAEKPLSLPKEKQFINKNSFLKRLKKIVSKGDLLMYDCGRLGSTKEQVFNKCGKKPYMYHRLNEIETVYYLKGDNWIKLEFVNGKLGEISISPNSIFNIPIAEMKKIIGEPDRTIEWNYKLSFHRYYINDSLILEITNGLGNMEGITLYDRNLIPEWEQEDYNGIVGETIDKY